MKLLYLHHLSPQNNQANIIQVLQMCYAFQKLGVDTTLALPAAKNCSTEGILTIIEKKLGKKLNFNILTYPQITFRGRGAPISAYWCARNLIKNLKDFDFCFTRSLYLNKLALGYGHKVIFESHSTLLYALKLINQIYIKRLLKDSKQYNQVLFIAISHALAEFWHKLDVPNEKILTLHDAVCSEDFASVETWEEARKKLKIKSNRKIVLYSGSLYKDRGIEQLLELAQSFPESDFMVLGGPEKQQIHYQELSRKMCLENIFFLGHVPHQQVKRYLSAADVLLMLFTWKVPTINICSPLKVFEYMAAERIIVGQNFPTIKEVLIDGENALLADPDSLGELKTKLGKALSMNYPNKLSTNARLDVMREYTWKKRALAILNKLDKKE